MNAGECSVLLVRYEAASATITLSFKELTLTNTVKCSDRHKILLSWHKIYMEKSEIADDSLMIRLVDFQNISFITATRWLHTLK
jgi:hypothetical protein